MSYDLFVFYEGVAQIYSHDHSLESKSLLSVTCWNSSSLLACHKALIVYWWGLRIPPDWMSLLCSTAGRLSHWPVAPWTMGPAGQWHRVPLQYCRGTGSPRTGDTPLVTHKKTKRWGAPTAVPWYQQCIRFGARCDMYRDFWALLLIFLD